MVNSKTGASREKGELSDNDKPVINGKGGGGSTEKVNPEIMKKSQQWP